MPRTGGGGSHGGGSSHSSHSSSRSHSSYSSSSSRSSGSFGSSGRSGGYRSQSAGSGGRVGSSPMSPRPSMPRRGGFSQFWYGYGGGCGYGFGRRRGCGLTSIVAVIAAVVILIVMFGALRLCSGIASAFVGGRSSMSVTSTINRERLSGSSFTDDCVVDELGWIREDGSSVSAVGKKLQNFWDATGIQPYIVLLSYKEDYSSADYRYDFADEYFEENIDDESAMLLIYFDAEYGDGWWEMVKGLQVDSVMDSEATEIFWNYLDRYWYDLSYTVPQAIVNTFDSTANVIMKKSTTALDVLKYVLVVVIIIVLCVAIIHIMKTKRKHEAERNAETERILNTPLSDAESPLVDKYTDSDSEKL